MKKYILNLKNPHVEKYFDMDEKEKDYYNQFQNVGIVELLSRSLAGVCAPENIKIIRDGDTLTISVNESVSDDMVIIDTINKTLLDCYSEREMHITRMFGSYIIIKKENGKLSAVKATPIPIKYCPLMAKLLEEVGGDLAVDLLKTLRTENVETQTSMMCRLINEVVIDGGYFDTNRPLNSCEANVLFGASETMSSAFKNNLIDAAVIVSNNLGTIITTNESNTQGAVKRMTGLFYTSPSKELIRTAKEANIIPVYPFTADIDQLEGVKKAISLGYRRIAVSVAANDNYLHRELKKLETDDIKIYKFGLCSTGISEETAIAMRDNADVVWSCASKQVIEYIEPNAIARVGIKIPVHIMTEAGWIIVKNHLCNMDNKFPPEDIELVKGDEKPVMLNDKSRIKVLKKKYIHKCDNCPYPCV